MEEHSLSTSRTAYYYTEGNITDPAHLWIVFHGYAQVADDFIRPFRVLDLEDNGIVAPEGLSRFYKEGVSGKVVSSWMTKRFRLSEIEDQFSFLDKLYAQYKKKNVRLHLLGFSQGVATMMRWVAHRKPSIESMIIWAGWPPEDIDYVGLATYWGTLNNYYVYGRQDQYLTAELIETFNARKDLQLLDLEHLVFDGNHRISRKTLQHLAEMINRTFFQSR